MNIYEKAVDYAYNLNSTLCKDIVHDAFLSFYNDHNKNLFNEKEVVVISKIKETWSKYNRRRVTVKRSVDHATNPEDEYIEKIERGFLTHAEIEEQMKIYEQYHRFFPKLHLN
jgi:hypothetical protein